MGYTTSFDGGFRITPEVKPEHVEYINRFSGTRRMKRKADVAASLPDDVRLKAGLPIGEDGGYFTGGREFMGQGDDASIVNHNQPPSSQPGLWCQWIITDNYLQWDRGEKFYHYEAWLTYLIEHFFEPWGYKLSGEVSWQGEDDNDRGTIYVKDNVVEAVEDDITNKGPSWSR